MLPYVLLCYGPVNGVEAYDRTVNDSVEVVVLRN